MEWPDADGCSEPGRGDWLRSPQARFELEQLHWLFERPLESVATELSAAGLRGIYLAHVCGRFGISARELARRAGRKPAAIPRFCVDLPLFDVDATRRARYVGDSRGIGERAAQRAIAQARRELTRGERRCEGCGRLLPRGARRQARYCPGRRRSACKQRAYRTRRRSG